MSYELFFIDIWHSLVVSQLQLIGLPEILCRSSTSGEMENGDLHGDD